MFQQKAFNARPKIGEHMLIVMDKSIHQETLAQPLQTNNNLNSLLLFLLVITASLRLLERNNFYFAKSIIDKDGFFQITIPPGAYELESLNNENKRNIIGEGHITQADYSFTIEPSFSTLGTIIEFSG